MVKWLGFQFRVLPVGASNSEVRQMFHPWFSLLILERHKRGVQLPCRFNKAATSMLPSGFNVFAFMVAESIKCHVNAFFDLGKQNTDNLTGAISRLESSTVSSRLLIVYIHIYICVCLMKYSMIICIHICLCSFSATAPKVDSFWIAVYPSPPAIKERILSLGNLGDLSILSNVFAKKGMTPVT